MQLKPCSSFAERGGPSKPRRTGAPWHWLRVPVRLSAPPFPRPPRRSAGPRPSLLLPGRRQGHAPRAPPPGRAPLWAQLGGSGPEVGPGPPARPSPRVSPVAPPATRARGRDTRDGHPLPQPTVTYVGGGCRRERCRPRGRTPARF